MQPKVAVPEALHLVAAVVDMQDDRERELCVVDVADHVVHGISLQVVGASPIQRGSHRCHEQVVVRYLHSVPLAMLAKDIHEAIADKELVQEAVAYVVARISTTAVIIVLPLDKVIRMIEIEVTGLGPFQVSDVGEELLLVVHPVAEDDAVQEVPEEANHFGTCGQEHGPGVGFLEGPAGTDL